MGQNIIFMSLECFQTSRSLLELISDRGCLLFGFTSPYASHAHTILNTNPIRNIKYLIQRPTAVLGGLKMCLNAFLGHFTYIHFIKLRIFLIFQAFQVSVLIPYSNHNGPKMAIYRPHSVFYRIFDVFGVSKHSRNHQTSKFLYKIC